MLYSDVGVVATADVDRRGSGTVTVELPSGATVRGMVVDEQDAPIAGAGVWTATRLDTMPATPTLRTEIDGTFRLVRGGGIRFLGATADGYAPSFAVAHAGGSSDFVRLRLHGEGGGLRGTVLDPKGELLAGASIEVPMLGDLMPDSRSDPACFPLPSVFVASDSRGAFSVDGVRPGPILLGARHGECAPWAAVVQVSRGAWTDVRISLTPGCAITGSVTSASTSEPTLVTIRTGRPGDLRTSCVRALLGGRYRLEGVEPGHVLLTADGGAAGPVSTSLYVLPGATAAWNPRLGFAAELRGTVREDDRPLAGWFVSTASDGATETVTETDATGQYRLQCTSTLAQTVRLFAPDSPTIVVARKDAVRPGTLDVDFALEKSDRRTCWIHGRVTDSEGAPLPDASVVAERDEIPGFRTASAQSAADGTFRLGPLPARSHLVTVMREGFGTARRSVAVFAPGDVQSWTPIVLHPGGSLVATLGADAVALPTTVEIVVVDPAGFVSDRESTNITSDAPALYRVGNLAPGTYSLSVSGPARGETTFEVTSGRTTELTLNLLSSGPR